MVSGKALEHDAEKSQTFRITSCVETKAKSEMAIQFKAISLWREVPQ
jgi:hypothetical protein